MGKSSWLIGPCLLAVVGILLMLNSPTMGEHAASTWLRGRGGSADSTQFQAMLTAYIDAYRILGAVLLGGGMFGVFQRGGSARG